MRVLSQWTREGSRKRAAADNDESDQGSLRKRTKNNDNGRRESIENAGANETEIGDEGNQEYKIRGSSNINKDVFHSSSQSPTFTPLATEPSRLSPSIHPDRLDNILNADPNHTHAPAASLDKRVYPLSPLPQALEHISKVDPEEQRPKPLHSLSHPNLRIDTARTGSSLDQTSPDLSSTMTSDSYEKSRDSPSYDPRISSRDSYRPNSNPSSGKPSQTMRPPSYSFKMTRSEDPTPKTRSPLTNSESEIRQPSSMQAQAPFYDSLNGFAQSIMSAASLTMKRDLMKQQAVGQQRERDRQSKTKSVFLTLVEDAELRIEGVEKASGELDKQFNLSSQTQLKNVNTLARLLKDAGVHNALSSPHDTARLKDDVADVAKDLKTTKKEIDSSRGRFHDDIADLKADLRAAEKKFDSLNRDAVMSDELRKKLRGLATKDELRGLVAKDEIRGLVAKDDLRRVTTDEVRKHITEALIPTEKKLASLSLEDASLSNKVKDAEALMQTCRETAEEKDQGQSSRFDRLETSLSNSRMEVSRLDLTIEERERDYAALKVDVEAQNKLLTELSTCVRPDPSNNILSLDKVVTKNLEQIKSLQQDCEKLNEAIRQTQELQAVSKLRSPEVSTASINADTKLVEEIKLIHSDLDALKAEQEVTKLIQRDLNALKVGQEKVELIRTDLDSLINEEKQKDASVAQGFEEISVELKKQREDLTRLQTEYRLVKQSQTSRPASNHPPTPPFARASISPRGSDQQKLQDVELGLRRLAQTTQTLELFVASQQQKFDRLTSDHLAQNMVHQMQQMYPQHPGNLLAWQAKVDSYLGGILKDRLATIDSHIDSLGGNLRDRLASIESQILAQMTTRRVADAKILELQEKIRDITQSTTETRNACFATINSMKKDIESLRDTVSCYPSQGSSDYGNRIDILVDRVSTVENKYVEAIADLEKPLMDLVRNVTNLQRRSGIGSSGNTPREPTAMSRSSKSAEPSGSTTISSENINDTDCSDTPLSVRRDREDRRSSDANLKRKAVESNGEDEDEAGCGEIGSTNAKKIPKRRNVSGKNPFP